MEDERMWVADHVVAPTPGFAITIPKAANKFAIKENHLTLVKGNQFNEMLQNYHGNNLSKGNIIKIFYRGLSKITQEVLNAAAGGIFLYKTPNQAYQLLKDKVLLKLDWAKNKKTRSSLKKTVAFADEAKNHQASIQNLETKFDRLADKQSGRPSGFLPSNTQPNPKGHNSKAYQPSQARNEHVNALFTRSGSKILHFIEGTLLEEEVFIEFYEFMAMTADENSDFGSDTEEQPFEKITINTNYKIKISLEEPPTDLELKPLPDNLEYVFLEEPFFLLVIISSQLSKEKKNKLVSVLKKHKQAFSWKTTDILRIFPSFCKHKIQLFDDKKPVVQKKKAGSKYARSCYDRNHETLGNRSYLIISKTIIHTDHSALRHLFKKQDAKPHLIRWILLLQEFDIEIKDRKGTKNVAADHLSQIGNNELSDDSEVDDNFPGETLMEIITKDEPWFADFANYLVGDVIQKGMKCYVSGPETRIILDQCHYGPIGGHYGPNITAKKVLDSGFYWPTIIKEAHTLVRLCEAYQNTSNISKHDKMPLNNIQAEAQALPTIDAPVVVTFLKRLFCHFEMPKAIISHRGTHFCNKIMERTMKRDGINHHFSTSCHPQTSGQVENTNIALKRIIEKIVKDNHAIWSRKLDDAMWDFRTAYKTHTGTTPYKLIYGKNYHLTFEIVHRTYWALKNCDLDLITVGDK
nr:reverse transcriptase domain-containing protein [Tanacetum cinerariifolium]